jgi:hypothetical protein
MPPACCPGLEPLQDCVPGNPCPGSLYFCLDCGDGVCDAHENPYNCLDDCRQGCDAGDSLDYTCPDGQTVSWCTCGDPSCLPECRHIGSYSEGWYDSCTGELLGDYRICAGQEPVCLYIGTDSEGWYAGEEGDLIDWAACARVWDCLIDPKVQCL